MILVQIGWALASMMSWIFFSDIPSDPEGYVRDALVSSFLFIYQKLTGERSPQIIVENKCIVARCTYYVTNNLHIKLKGRRDKNVFYVFLLHAALLVNFVQGSIFS